MDQIPSVADPGASLTNPPTKDTDPAATGLPRRRLRLTYDLEKPGAGDTSADFWDEVFRLGYAHYSSDSWIRASSPDLAAFDGWTALGSSQREGSLELLLRTEGALLRLALRSEVTVIHVAACSQARALAITEQLRKTIPERPVEVHGIRMQFSYWTDRGAGSTERYLDAPSWAEIRGNYAQRICGELDRSLAPDWRPGSAGKLLLWHGPPGCGKTYAIRALVREWKEWCTSTYVADPENFLGNSAYMAELLTRDTRATSAGKWHLLILEDCGELLARDAKMRTGQALSRLLNISDGLIGQGLRLLLLITTNEETGAMHEAVNRPGRCMSRLTFEALSREESQAWLRERGLPTEAATSSLTLAELYATARGDVGETRARQVGFGLR